MKSEIQNQPPRGLFIISLGLFENFDLTSDNICRKCAVQCNTCTGPSPNQCLSCKDQDKLKETPNGHKCESGNRKYHLFSNRMALLKSSQYCIEI